VRAPRLRWLYRLLVWSGAVDKERYMGFTPPTGMPVPIVHVQELGWRFGFWYAFNSAAGVCVAGIFGKAPNAADFNICASILVNQTPSENREIVDTQWENNEVKVIETHLAELNVKFDEWLRANVAWENLQAVTLLSESEIDALPDGYAQLNWTVASKFGFVVDPTKKKLDVVRTA
jgi:hypothetical protein